MALQINEKGITLIYIFISREFANKVVATRPRELIDLSQSRDNCRVLIYDVLHFLVSILGQFDLSKRYCCIEYIRRSSRNFYLLIFMV